MTAIFTQFVGETIDYRQSIVDDVIVSATWSCDPGGTVITIDPGTSATTTIGRFTTNKSGRITLRATMKLASGQTRIGEARILVSP